MPQPDRQTGMFSYAHKTWNDGQAETAKVGLYPPNAWGLHDMHGNLAELTSTPYHAERNPPEAFDTRLGWVCKGGSWLSTAKYCRSAFRGQFTFRSRENTTENFLGLRLVSYVFLLSAEAVIPDQGGSIYTFEIELEY